MLLFYFVVFMAVLALYPPAVSATDTCYKKKCTNSGKGNHFVCKSEYAYSAKSTDRATCNCGDADLCECSMEYGECHCGRAKTCITKNSIGDVFGECAMNVTCDNIGSNMECNAGMANYVTCLGSAKYLDVRKDTSIVENQCGTPKVSAYGGSSCLSVAETVGIIIGALIIIALIIIYCKYQQKIKDYCRKSSSSTTNDSSGGISVVTSSYSDDKGAYSRNVQNTDSTYYPVGVAAPPPQGGPVVGGPAQTYSNNI